MAIPKITMSLPKKQLISRVLDAVRLCGWNAMLLNDAHPLKLSVFRDDDTHRLILYIWNITHGGYPRNPNELRIQVTGIDEFHEEDGFKTLVLGWSEDLQCFAGFDVTKHRVDMSGRSPSFQIRRQAFTNALSHGVDTQEKGNDEIAIAFRPDFFMTYVEKLNDFHGCSSRSDFSTLGRIVSAPNEAQIVDVPAGPRRTVLQELQRKIRDTRFRKNVMLAYEQRCAISGIQLDLLDAAHIVPVEHEQGTDELKNGICMSAIHHRAFDRGLIAVRTDYSIVINPTKLSHLRSVGWDGGFDMFKSTLRDQIILPRRREHYPDPEKLVFGQTLRGWTERQLRN